MNNSIGFKLKYNKCTNSIKDVIKSSYSKIQNTFSSLNGIQLKTINTVNNNIGSTLIFNKKPDIVNLRKTLKCQNNCSNCKFIYNSYAINFNYNYYFPLLENGDCNSTGIIYFIFCKKCNLIYIGQSKNSLKKRISNHLSTIKKFNRELPDENHEIAYHFNLKGHNIISHFTTGILRKNILDDEMRLRIEKDFINIFEAIHPPTINRLKPSLFDMNNVLFSNNL